MPLTTQPTLMSRMRDGDLAAWDQFALEATPFVLRWLRAEFSLSVQDAEDLWQDIFLKKDKVIRSYFASRFRSVSFPAGKLAPLAGRLINPERPIDQRLAVELDSEVVKLLAERLKAAAERPPDSIGAPQPAAAPDKRSKDDQPPDPKLEIKRALAKAFNRVVEGPSLYDPADASRLEGVGISARTRRLLDRRAPVDTHRLNWLLLHDAYRDEVVGIEGRLRGLVLSELRQDRLRGIKYDQAQKRDVRKTVSGNEPISPDDPDGATRFDELEAERQKNCDEKCRTVAEILEDLLRDYPDPIEKRAYLAWFWTKADDDLNDPAIAARLRLTISQLRYIRANVEDYLCRHRGGDFEF